MIVLSSIMVHNFNSTNKFIQEQLHSSANDTATSLGLSISSANESASIEVMINAIFDSGYYELISYTNRDDNFNRLDIKIIAIGVNSAEMLQQLKALNVNYFQGNYIAKAELHTLPKVP